MNGKKTVGDIVEVDHVLVRAGSPHPRSDIGGFGTPEPPRIPQELLFTTATPNSTFSHLNAFSALHTSNSVTFRPLPVVDPI